MKGGSRKPMYQKRRSGSKRSSKKRGAKRKVYSAYQAFLFDYYDILKNSGCNNMKNWMKIAAAAYRGEDVSDMCYL
jgi:hypothetical protein